MPMQKAEEIQNGAYKWALSRGRKRGRISSTFFLKQIASNGRNHKQKIRK